MSGTRDGTGEADGPDAGAMPNHAPIPEGEPIAVLRASPGRRVAGVSVTGGVGLMLAWLAAAEGQGSGVRLALAGGGCAALLLAAMLWRATARGLVLTPAGLRDSDGRMVAAIGDVVSVTRGTFAFKPSNGFVLCLSRSGGAAWAPGLWWRIGRHVGVGGVTPADRGRAMAEAIAEAATLLRDRRVASRRPSG